MIQVDVKLMVLVVLVANCGGINSVVSERGCFVAASGRLCLWLWSWYWILLYWLC